MAHVRIIVKWYAKP